MNRSLLKRIFLVLAVGALILVFLSGCGKKNKRDIILTDPNDGSRASKIYLTFFGFKADAINLTAIEEALQSFMSAHKNIDITYEGIKGLEYWKVFDKRDAANVLDDIFMMHHDHVVAMSAQGKLANLSDLPGLGNYTAEARGQFVNFDGSVYFLPTQISTYNLFINYDLLKAHGQSIPENWGEFQKVCDYFVGKGIVPIIANNRNSLATLILSRGLFPVYQQPNVSAIIQKFNENPALLAKTLAPGVELAAEVLKRGWVDAAEVLVTKQTADDLAIFLKGERPFMITGGWASVRVKAQKPKFSYGVHPYPILDDGSVLSLQVDTCISVNAKSKHLKEAKEFVQHLISPDVMWTYCDSQASYTPLKEEKRLPSEPTLRPSTDYLKNGRVAFRAEYRLNLPMDTALFYAARALLKGSSVAEAQAVLATELEKK